jgi:hypothetical protein
MSVKDPDPIIKNITLPVIKLVGSNWIYVIPGIICSILAGAAQIFFFTLLGALIDAIMDATPTTVT